MTYRGGVAALICMLVASTARADIHDEMDQAAWASREREARALADAVVKAINAGDAKAFAALFIDDGAVILPAAADEGAGKAAIEVAARRWLASKPTVKLDQLHVPTKADWKSGTAPRPWFDGELVTKTGRWRITGVGYQPPEQQQYKLGALHISEAVDDKAALAAATVGQLPALHKLGDGESGRDELAKIPKLFAAHVFDVPAVALTGTAPKEHVYGKAAVAKQLAGWRNLKLTARGSVHGPETEMWGTEWHVGHLDATFMVNGMPVVVPYRALLLVETFSGPALEHGASNLLIAAHFSVATH